MDRWMGREKRITHREECCEITVKGMIAIEIATGDSGNGGINKEWPRQQ